MPCRHCVESWGEKQWGWHYSFEEYPSDSTFPLRERRRSVFNSPEMFAINYKRGRQRWQRANREAEVIDGVGFHHFFSSVQLLGDVCGFEALQKWEEKSLLPIENHSKNDLWFVFFGFMSSVWTNRIKGEIRSSEESRHYYSSSM